MTKTGTRLSAMAAHNSELTERLMEKPEVAGIIWHGSFSDKPRHESDATSDLDLTVIIDTDACKDESSGDPRPYIPWLNFKSYQAIGSNDKPLEVDMYYFDLRDARPWGAATREGYAYSSKLVYERPSCAGKVQQWLSQHTEITPEFRLAMINKLMAKAESMFSQANMTSSPIDKRLLLTKVTKLLVEVVFYINWEYPPDLKWRISGSHVLKWRPKDFVSFVGRCNETIHPGEMDTSIANLFTAVRNKLSEEGLVFKAEEADPKVITKVTDMGLQIARLFTRIDKYSAHSVKKCVNRGFPWNAHDLISEGVENAVDIIYYLNGEEVPSCDKVLHLEELAWKPKWWSRYFYQASTVSNYEDADDALKRTEALRQLFYSIKAKIEELDLFSTSSLYAEDFMGEDLFSERSPYMKVFKAGMYCNRQQKQDTFAEIICRKVNLPTRQKNILFGMCSHYLLSDEEELMALNEGSIHSYYLPTWEEVVKQLSVK